MAGMGAAVVTALAWPGPYQTEGTAAYHRARESGISSLRALAVGVIASFKDGWIFRRNIAKFLRCSVRTVQRGLTDARAAGLIGVYRAKKNEIPPGCSQPLPCGWSHRITTGWGKAGTAVKEAVEKAKARWFVKHALPQARADKPALSVGRSTMDQPKRPSRPEFQRKMTAAEIDRELERLDTERLKKPPPS